MPNIASALKSEITRLSRKEVRAQTAAASRALTTYRRQMVDLKRRVEAMEKQIRRLAKAPVNVASAEHQEDAPNLRFRASGFAQHRQRLGLSAKDMGLLLNASALSVYKWESGQARPRAKHLQAIAEVRKIGKREAQKRLAEIRAA